MNYAVEMGVKRHDIHTKFHKTWFWHSKVKRRDTHTDTNTGR
jgi:hypothetical protein